MLENDWNSLYRNNDKWAAIKNFQLYIRISLFYRIYIVSKLDRKGIHLFYDSNWLKNVF